MRAPRRSCSRASSCWSSYWPSGPHPPRLLDGAQEIPLADFHAALAQQCIDHAVVEIEVWQHEVGQIPDAGELPGAVWELDFDIAALGVLQLRRIDGLHEIQGFRDACL